MRRSTTARQDTGEESAEEKVRCLEEKKERISKKLASPEVDERTKERLQKRLQCVNARMERMKSAAVCSEKTNKPAVKQTPQEREEKKARSEEKDGRGNEEERVCKRLKVIFIATY